MNSFRETLGYIVGVVLLLKFLRKTRGNRLSNSRKAWAFWGMLKTRVLIYLERDNFLFSTRGCNLFSCLHFIKITWFLQDLCREFITFMECLFLKDYLNIVTRTENGLTVRTSFCYRQDNVSICRLVVR